MKKGIRIAIIGVACAITMLVMLPYLFVSSPFVNRSEIQIPAKIDDTFRVLEDLRTWPKWAWLWSETPNLEVIWYDNSSGQYAGFYWERAGKIPKHGVLEAQSLKAPAALTYVVISDQEPEVEIAFTLEATNDTTTQVVMQTMFPVGNMPWERFDFWLKKGKLQKKKKAELGRFKSIFSGK